MQQNDELTGSNSKNFNFPHPRNKTIGILGGGQLGRMLAMAAGRLGFYTIILDPQQNCPAAQFANHQIVANYDDKFALDLLAQNCFVTTYEFENIPLLSASTLDKFCDIFPAPFVLATSQDRLSEKQFIGASGMKTARFLQVDDANDLEKAIRSIPLPAILKTRRMGYDGKGQIRLNSNNAEPTAFDITGDIAKILQSECILEELVEFDCEISIIGARGRDGRTICYDPARNTHKDGILVHSQVPCLLAQKIIDQAKIQTVTLMNKLEYIGVIGVEFFVCKNEDLLINEFAPRVHNSGHWTEAACQISQFEQHIRAICGLPLASTQRHSNCQMHNLIGTDIDQFAQIAAKPDTLVHHYAKHETRAGRKMGHFTTITSKT